MGSNVFEGNSLFIRLTDFDYETSTSFEFEIPAKYESKLDNFNSENYALVHVFNYKYITEIELLELYERKS